MPIPAVTSEDAFLRTLLDEQIKLGIDGKVKVEDVMRGLPIDTHEEVLPGQELRIEAKKLTEVGKLVCIGGTVSVGGEMVANGELTVVSA